MLPDTGERYLSTALFEDIPADMTADEIEISRSTPRYRFDQANPPQPAKEPAAGTEVPPAAAAFVDEILGDAKQPVVMFALEWCEFCWSVRKLFAKVGVAYQAIELDSVAYQKNNWGGQIRAALKERLGSPTIPQIFVGGEYIGGCTETFDAFNEGSLQQLLAKNAVSVADARGIDAYSFLPTWLHPRQAATS